MVCRRDRGAGGVFGPQGPFDAATKCPANTYKNYRGAATRCLGCPPDSTTNGVVGATYAAQCRCKKVRAHDGGAALPDDLLNTHRCSRRNITRGQGYSGTAGGACTVCPAGYFQPHDDLPVATCEKCHNADSPAGSTSEDACKVRRPP